MVFLLDPEPNLLQRRAAAGRGGQQSVRRVLVQVQPHQSRKTSDQPGQDLRSYIPSAAASAPAKGSPRRQVEPDLVHDIICGEGARHVKTKR